MLATSEEVFPADSFGFSKSDLNEIWREYFGFDDHAEHGVHIDGRVRPFSKNRVGYLGDHFILEIESAETPTKQITLFFKTFPSNLPSLADYLQSTGTARKESNVYRKLLSKMRQFSRFAAQCFLASEIDGRFLVMENLHTQGFRNITDVSTGIFDKKHLECAIVALAKFHSASLLLEKKTGNSLTLLAPGVLEENAWIERDNNPRMDELDNAIQVLLAFVNVIEKNNPLLESILQQLPALIQQIYEFVKPSHEYRNVACHGDLWANNMMFRYEVSEERSAPVECLLVDFQFTRYAPPAYDLNMLITLTTNAAFRKMHRNELISFYFRCMLEELKQHLSQCSAPGEPCHEESFYKSCDFYKTCGLIENFLMNHVTLLPRHYVNKIFSSAECYNNFSGDGKIKICLEVLQNDAVYCRRMVDIVRALIDIL